MSEPLTIHEAAEQIRSGALTPTELLEQCLRRIDQYEPRVQAWVYLDRARARMEAKELTQELTRGNHRGPLHGIPVGIKDIIDVFDMPTGCGSKLWSNSYARQDASCVKNLRDAGALILGKTVTTPYAFFDPSITRNPWNLKHTPGGSSSGSAAAVACGMCLAALGTQTGGSITRPASYCGVCSLKPSWGQISVEGVMPFAASLDHVGVMANSVQDLALMFQTLVQGSIQPDHSQLLENLPVEIDELATPILLTGMFDDLRSPEMAQLFDAQLRRNSSNSFIRGTCRPPIRFHDLSKQHRLLMAVEVSRIHRSRIERRPEEYPQHMTALIHEGLEASAAMLLEADLLQSDLADEVSELLNERHVFVTPATTDLPPDISTTGRPVFNSPWSFTGHPTVSVPMGLSPDGLPYAMQLIGPMHEESQLLAVAAWYEKALARPHIFPPVS